MRSTARWIRNGVRSVAVFAAVMVAGACHSRTVHVAPNDPCMLDFQAMNDANPTLQELEFMWGTWRTLDEQGLSEEWWSVPHGNSMVGTFRMSGTDGLLKMQEVLSIVAEPGGTFMRLRHFDPGMVAREKKDAPVVLKLETAAHREKVISPDQQPDEPIQLCGNRWDAQFRCVSGSASLASISYTRVDAKMYVEIAFTAESKRETLRFGMRRPSAWPP